MALGTTTSNAIHFVVNGGATDAMTISSAGAVTFGTALTSPTFVTPALGTPATGTLTNCTGYTIANLSDGAWTSWTPTLTNMTLGNGTLSCKYKTIGKTVFFRFQFVLGSTSTMGTNPLFSIPVTSITVPSSFVRCGAGEADTNVPALYPVVCIWSTTTTFTIYSQAAPYASITATAPFTWNTGCILAVHGFYEIP